MPTLTLLLQGIDDFGEIAGNLGAFLLLVVELAAEIVVGQVLLAGGDVGLAGDFEERQQALISHGCITRAEALGLRVDPLVDARLDQRVGVRAAIHLSVPIGHLAILVPVSFIVQMMPFSFRANDRVPVFEVIGTAEA